MTPSPITPDNPEAIPETITDPDEPVLLCCEWCGKNSWAPRSKIADADRWGRNTITGTWLRCGHCNQPLPMTATERTTTPDNPEAIRREVEGQIVALIDDYAAIETRAGERNGMRIIRNAIVDRLEHRTTPLPQSDRIGAEELAATLRREAVLVRSFKPAGMETRHLTDDIAANIEAVARALSQPAP